MNLLSQLKQFTTVVADTGDFESIERYKPQDATTNPSLILAAAKNEDYRSVISDVIATALNKQGSANAADLSVTDLVDDLFVAFGCKILKVIPGRVSTEVDARLSFDSKKTVERAHSIMAKYHEHGVSADRILIKIASTWEGIEACRVLESEGIHCNMTLMFGLHQAVACADAGATLISPFVGRILDWHKKNSGKAEYAATEDPGVLSVQEIYYFYKQAAIQTEVMGASFRNLGEILELAGCDLLTIAPKFLDELQSQMTTQDGGKLSAVLTEQKARSMALLDISDTATQIERPLTKAQYDTLHQQNQMASDKLAEGIQSFSEASEALEALISEMLL